MKGKINMARQKYDITYLFPIIEGLEKEKLLSSTEIEKLIFEISKVNRRMLHSIVNQLQYNIEDYTILTKIEEALEIIKQNEYKVSVLDLIYCIEHLKSNYGIKLVDINREIGKGANYVNCLKKRRTGTINFEEWEAVRKACEKLEHTYLVKLGYA